MLVKIFCGGRARVRAGVNDCVQAHCTTLVKWGSLKYHNNFNKNNARW